MIPWFNIDQYLPHYGNTIVGIHAFGILVAIGILVGARLTQHRARELGVAGENDKMVSSMITWTLLVGFEFAHIFDVFAYKTLGPLSDVFQTLLHPLTVGFAVWAKKIRDILNPFLGFSSYGGFIGALIGLFSWAHKKRVPVMPYADSLAYGLAAGWLFGRLGCFTAHDHPGRHTTFFLAVHYPDGVRFDLGLLEAIWAGGMTLLFYLLHKRKQPLGTYVSLLTICYAPIRFVLDFLRATDVSGADPRYFGLTPAQYGSILVLFAGIGLLLWTRRHAEAASA